MDKRRTIITSRLNELHENQKCLEQRIVELTPQVPKITDHAIVRYIERVMGMDLDNLKQQIVGSADRDWLFDYQSNGSGRFMVSNTHRVHIENNAMVTVLPR